jgi:predicted nucleic acid-binding protein
MIYIDANIFVYAYFRAKKRTLPPKTRWIKEEAKKIIKEISESNSNSIKYCISLIQVSEITNILASNFEQNELHEFLMGLFSNPCIEIIEINNSDYLNAIEKMKEYDLDANDICALLVMKSKKTNKIYTFDSGFRKLKDIICLPTIPEKFEV